MRRVLVLAFLAGAAAAVLAQVEPAPRPGYVQVMMTDAKVAAGYVTRFSFCVDNQPCQHAELAAIRASVPEWYEWKLPPLTLGPHTVTVQACNDFDCGEAAPATFAVRIVPAKVDRVLVPPGGGVEP